MEAGEDVSLTVDFSGVEFVEKCHEHKGVEDDREVFRWSTETLC